MESADTNDQVSAASKGKNWFATTHWSVVLAAGRKTTQSSQAALDTLCRTYWFPLYTYVRRAGHSAHDAQDLTQDFILRLLDKGYLALADQNRGKFRTFLLSSMKHFLINQHERSETVRRGGGRLHFSIDADQAEQRYAVEPTIDLTPEKHFEEQWAMTLIEQALKKLRGEYSHADNQALFEKLKEHLWGDKSLSYAQIGEPFGMNEGAVKHAAYRLRQRFAETLRVLIADTVSSPDHIEEELNDLIQAVKS